jgi:hypothetical protein
MGKGDMVHQGQCWTPKQMPCLPMQFICSKLERLRMLNENQNGFAIMCKIHAHMVHMLYTMQHNFK